MNIDKIASNGPGFCVLFGYFFLMAMGVAALWEKALDKPMEDRFPTLFAALMLWFFGARMGAVIGESMEMAEYVDAFTWAALIYIMIRYFQKADGNAEARPKRKD